MLLWCELSVTNGILSVKFHLSDTRRSFVGHKQMQVNLESAVCMCVRCSVMLSRCLVLCFFDERKRSCMNDVLSTHHTPHHVTYVYQVDYITHLHFLVWLISISTNRHIENIKLYIFRVMCLQVVAAEAVQTSSSHETTCSLPLTVRHVTFVCYYHSMWCLAYRLIAFLSVPLL